MPLAKRSLVDKLGIKQGFRMIIINPPHNYDKILGKLPANVIVVRELKGPLDFIHFFAKERQDLENEFPVLKQELSQRGMIWISWPKRSSGIATDLSEEIVREIGLNNQLVDVKVCAIDEIWSGLKFVHRIRKGVQL